MLGVVGLVCASLQRQVQQGMDVKRTKLGAAPARVPLQPTVVPQATVVQPQDTVQSTPSTVPSTVPTSLDTCSGAQEEGPLQSYIISPQRCAGCYYLEEYSTDC